MLKKIANVSSSEAEVANELNALGNRVAALEAAVESGRQLLKSAEASLAARLDAELLALVKSMLRQRAVLTPPMEMTGQVDLTPLERPTLEESLALLSEKAPAAFALWRELLDVNARTYTGFPVHSCSVGGHEMADLFRCFLRPYLTGTVLDVGCGPQPVPVYLADHPAGLIAGIDPLTPSNPHPFAFARGVCEHLPWPDAVFDLVVVATSLDHVLLLDRAMAEIERVLAPGGHLAIWVSFVEGSEPYDPHRPDIACIDEYHLFHFDRPWFETLFRARFLAREIVPVGRGNCSCFYCFRLA